MARKGKTNRNKRRQLKAPEVEVNRGGRPRKEGPRHASGQRIQRSEPNDRIKAMRAALEAGLIAKGQSEKAARSVSVRTDFNDPVSLMEAHGVLTERRAKALDTYYYLHRKATIGVFPDPGSVTLKMEQFIERSSPGFIFQDADRKREIAERRFREARALLKGCGQQAFQEVHYVAIMRDWPRWFRPGMEKMDDAMRRGEFHKGVKALEKHLLDGEKKTLAA